jgi:hypothetical protein
MPNLLAFAAAALLLPRPDMPEGIAISSTPNIIINHLNRYCQVYIQLYQDNPDDSHCRH